MNTPRPIGFWYYPHSGQEELPRPRDLVRSSWITADEKTKLVAYLKCGATYEAWRGLSHCRFRCGIDDRYMGHRDFTDGLWVWPEGLHHYVDKHDVMLPEEFVAHCRAGGWGIPSDALKCIELSHDLDYSSWIAWSTGVRAGAEPSSAEV